MKFFESPVASPKTGVLFPSMNARRASVWIGLFAARLVVATALFVCGFPLHAQIASQPVPPPVQPDAQKLNAEELARLLAPIALYPDALIAIILPASTVPSDVVLGARYLKSGGDPGQIENQPWDESVQALARYPDVLAWMDESLEWTASLGEAFVEQPADVMNAIQALREQAKAAGNLGDTPQQKVVEEGSAIRIVPADPEVIYVPQYDPQVVYVYSSVLTFGPGFFVGPWLCYDFDWNRRCFYRGNWLGWNHDWHNQWNHGPNGNRGGANVVNIDTTNASQWQPSANAQRQINQRQIHNNGNARYVSARSGAVGAQQPVALGNANIPTARPGIYNPALRTALPMPSNSVRLRDQAPVRTGNPAIYPPSNPASLPQNARSIPEAPPARPARTVTAPVIQQQYQERQQFQPQRQQVQERLQPAQPREQATQPDQRQLRPEIAVAPSLQQQRPAPAAQPQVQGQPTPAPPKKKQEEKKAE